MLHDISHCNKSTCPNCEKCYRYLAHLEAEERGYEYLSYIDWKNVKEQSECPLFWEIVNNELEL